MKGYFVMSDLDAKTIENLHAAHHVDGIPPERRLVPHKNFRHLLATHAKTSGEKVFLIHLDKDGNREELTYSQINTLVHQTANFLYSELGVRRGDHVATIAYNHSDTVIVYFACWLMGAVVAPQNIAEDDQRIAFILRNSEAVVCLARNDYLERAERIINGDESDELGASNIRSIVTMGGAATEKYPHFNDIVNTMPQVYLDEDGNEPQVTLDDDALLVYTSGTTGAPKGVVLTQYNLLADALGISAAQGITGNQRMMCVLPAHHVNGIVVTLVTPLFVGASVVFNRSFSPRRFWGIVRDEHVNIVSVVPTLLQFLLEYGRTQLEDGHSLFGEGLSHEDIAHFRHFICGAGTLSVSLARNFEDTFEIPILHGYGLSESTCYSCFMPIDISWEEHKSWLRDHDYPSIGVPIHTNEIGIFEFGGSGLRLEEGERGEICIRGHNIMKNYFKRPDANMDSFWFGWFRSGDEGFYLEDERGRTYIFITGRIKELINRGGVKFSPFDIEEVLLELDGIKIGLSVAFENDYYGEEVGAFVVLEYGVKLSEEDILKHCRERMTFEKSPKVIIFGDDVPVTTTGKYKRLKLQDLFIRWKSTQFRK
jgi:acyl-CoA synthetase (AMP-forming)/AMP-acid ligase II